MEQKDEPQFVVVKIGGKDEFDISDLLTPEENAERNAWLQSWRLERGRKGEGDAVQEGSRD